MSDDQGSEPYKNDAKSSRTVKSWVDRMLTSRSDDGVKDVLEKLGKKGHPVASDAEQLQTLRTAKPLNIDSIRNVYQFLPPQQRRDMTVSDMVIVILVVLLIHDKLHQYQLGSLTPAGALNSLLEFYSNKRWHIDMNRFNQLESELSQMSREQNIALRFANLSDYRREHIKVIVFGPRDSIGVRVQQARDSVYSYEQALLGKAGGTVASVRHTAKRESVPNEAWVFRNQNAIVIVHFVGATENLVEHIDRHDARIIVTFNSTVSLNEHEDDVKDYENVTVTTDKYLTNAIDTVIREDVLATKKQ